MLQVKKVHSNWTILYISSSFNKKRKEAFLWLWGTVICVVDHKQSELGTGCGSYAVVLLVSLLVSLMITKFIGLRERCFVLALCTYVYYFWISCQYTRCTYIHSVCLARASQWPLNQRVDLVSRCGMCFWDCPSCICNEVWKVRGERTYYVERVSWIWARFQTAQNARIWLFLKKTTCYICFAGALSCTHHSWCGLHGVEAAFTLSVSVFVPGS